MYHVIAPTGLGIVLLASCANLNPYDMNPAKTQTDSHVTSFASLTDEKNKTVVGEKGRFRAALLATSSDPDNKENANDYLVAGVAVADLYCRTYFQKLAVQRADQEAYRGTSNILDGTFSAILGLAGASANTVAGVSVLFTAAEAQFENIDAAYLVSPEVEQVEALVFDARDTLYAEIFSNGGPDSYYEAERRLAAYHQLCTFTGSTRLVNEAVANGKPILRTNKTEARDRLALIAAQGTVQGLSKLLAQPNTVWTLDEVTPVYAYYKVSHSADDGVNDAILDKIGTQLQTPTLSDKSDSDYKSSVANALAFLDSKRSAALVLLGEIDRNLDLDGPALRFVTAAQEAKSTVKDAKNTKLAYCGEPETDDLTAKYITATAALAGIIGEQQANDAMKCPAEGALVSLDVELPPVSVKDTVEDRVNLVVRVQ